jgi:hypothetical protein
MKSFNDHWQWMERRGILALVDIYHVWSKINKPKRLRTLLLLYYYIKEAFSTINKDEFYFFIKNFGEFFNSIKINFCSV